jgi:hypothetical protein
MSTRWSVRFDANLDLMLWDATSCASRSSAPRGATEVRRGAGTHHQNLRVFSGCYPMAPRGPQQT